MNVRFILYLKSSTAADALELIPESARRWRREALWQALKAAGDEKLEASIASEVALTPLKDPSLQNALRARPPWEDRQKFYAIFAEITGESRPWSLGHPFDDLDGAGMKAAIEAARAAKAEGLRKLDADARHLLLKADAVDFFQRLLEAAQ